MDQRNRRFRCLPEPSGTWTVWDDVTGAPANLDGCMLEGRSKDRARAACEILERIYRNRLDAFSVRQGSRTGAAGIGRQASKPYADRRTNSAQANAASE